MKSQAKRSMNRMSITGSPFSRKFIYPYKRRGIVPVVL